MTVAIRDIDGPSSTILVTTAKREQAWVLGANACPLPGKATLNRSRGGWLMVVIMIAF
jgi:hypothetical protein